jgi:hypothetical protein
MKKKKVIGGSGEIELLKYIIDNIFIKLIDALLTNNDLVPIIETINNITDASKVDKLLNFFSNKKKDQTIKDLKDTFNNEIIDKINKLKNLPDVNSIELNIYEIIKNFLPYINTFSDVINSDAANNPTHKINFYTNIYNFYEKIKDFIIKFKHNNYYDNIKSNILKYIDNINRITSDKTKTIKKNYEDYMNAINQLESTPPPPPLSPLPLPLSSPHSSPQPAPPLSQNQKIPIKNKLIKLIFYIEKYKNTVKTYIKGFDEIFLNIQQVQKEKENDADLVISKAIAKGIALKTKIKLLKSIFLLRKLKEDLPPDLPQDLPQDLPKKIIDVIENIINEVKEPINEISVIIDGANDSRLDKLGRELLLPAKQAKSIVILVKSIIELLKISDNMKDEIKSLINTCTSLITIEFRDLSKIDNGIIIKNIEKEKALKNIMKSKVELLNLIIELSKLKELNTIGDLKDNIDELIELLKTKYITKINFISVTLDLTNSDERIVTGITEIVKLYLSLIQIIVELTGKREIELHIRKAKDQLIEIKTNLSNLNIDTVPNPVGDLILLKLDIVKKHADIIYDIHTYFKDVDISFLVKLKSFTEIANFTTSYENADEKLSDTREIIKKIKLNTKKIYEEENYYSIYKILKISSTNEIKIEKSKDDLIISGGKFTTDERIPNFFENLKPLDNDIFKNNIKFGSITKDYEYNVILDPANIESINGELKGDGLSGKLYKLIEGQQKELNKNDDTNIDVIRGKSYTRGNYEEIFNDPNDPKDDSFYSEYKLEYNANSKVRLIHSVGPNFAKNDSDSANAYIKAYLKYNIFFQIYTDIYKKFTRKKADITYSINAELTATGAAVAGAGAATSRPANDPKLLLVPISAGIFSKIKDVNGKVYSLSNEILTIIACVFFKLLQKEDVKKDVFMYSNERPMYEILKNQMLKINSLIDSPTSPPPSPPPPPPPPPPSSS